MTSRTPQQIADAAAKRRATQAANRANGVPTVRQQRAAAKAAKAGQPYAPPPPRATPYRRRRHGNYNNPPAPARPQTPIFSAPKPDYRSLRLVALAALEALFAAKLTEKGAVVTQDIRDAFTKYKKVKALALGPVSSDTARVEADSALRMAIVNLVKLT